MEIPFKGNVKHSLLVKKYKNKILYYVENATGKSSNCKIRPCKISNKTNDFLSVIFYDINEYGFTTSRHCRWDNLFFTVEEAIQCKNYIDDLRNTGFYSTPFVDVEILKKHKKDMLFIENSIKEALKDFENFIGIDFCDVSGKGIDIRLFHKEIKKYSYGGQPTLYRDFSNIDSVIQECINEWKEIDVPDKILSEKEFIRQGEKYGWD